MNERPPTEEALRLTLLGGLTLRQHLAAVEKDLIVSVLAAVGQSQMIAAQVCGMTVDGFHEKLMLHGIEPVAGDEKFVRPEKAEDRIGRLSRRADYLRAKLSKGTSGKGASYDRSELSALDWGIADLCEKYGLQVPEKAELAEPRTPDSSSER